MPRMVSASNLAKAILADREREIAPNKALPCFACGRSFTYKKPKDDESGRFCCVPCRKAYDAGYQPKPPVDVFAVKWPSQIGQKKIGQKIGQTELIRPRRKCVTCGGNIPVWLKGRKVSERRKKCLKCSA